ncbi:Cathepsin D-like [Oopsacas minuta]|uniref:Cathepsin D-like n=1 Tax=Oopsacas minuta TaxID=111878 RepID=A0AAV7JC63_9METZ|nr:Cathepsin D-like [Oopsacas minuta]
MYSRVCLLCIIVILSIGHVVCKAGVRKNAEKFCMNFDIIYPLDDKCERMSNQSESEVDLFGIVDKTQLENIHNGSKNCKGHTKYVVDKKEKYKPFKIEYGEGDVEGKEITKDVKITDKFTVEKQLFGAASKVGLKSTGLDDVMGLDLYMLDGHPSVFNNMIKQELIKDPILGVLVTEEQLKKGGELMFGGTDEWEYIEDTGVKAKMHTGGLTTTTMTSLTFDKVTYCGEEKKACNVVVDLGCSDIYGPKEFVDAVNKIIVPEGDVVDCDLRDSTPAIEIKFGEQTITLEAEYYIKQIRTTCYTTIFIDEEEIDWQFGLPFFVKYYIAFDFTDKEEAICFFEK